MKKFLLSALLAAVVAIPAVGFAQQWAGNGSSDLFPPTGGGNTTTSMSTMKMRGGSQGGGFGNTQFDGNTFAPHISINVDPNGNITLTQFKRISQDFGAPSGP